MGLGFIIGTVAGELAVVSGLSLIDSVLIAAAASGAFIGHLYPSQARSTNFSSKK